jgi:hypothetical protein
VKETKPKVVDTSGKEVDTDQKPNGELLDLARAFLDDVLKGKVKVAVVASDGEGGPMVGCAGGPIEVLGLLSRAEYEINARMDEEEEEEPA